jgi:hypothetical protein
MEVLLSTFIPAPSQKTNCFPTLALSTSAESFGFSKFRKPV